MWQRCILDVGGAEDSEVVGIFIFYQLLLKYDKKKIALYRDDGLAVLKNITGQQSDKLRNIFRRSSVKLIEISLNIILKLDCLDVTLNS